MAALTGYVRPMATRVSVEMERQILAWAKVRGLGRSDAMRYLLVRGLEVLGSAEPKEDEE